MCPGPWQSRHVDAFRRRGCTCSRGLGRIRKCSGGDPLFTAIDPRDWSVLFAKSMLFMWMMEALVESRAGDEPIDVKVPADLRSDFANLFTSYSNRMAKNVQRLGHSPREELLRFFLP